MATDGFLFDKGEWWDEEWQGMPEFAQNDLAPWKTIYVHFESREDMEAFAKLVDQRVTVNTQSIWFPQAEIGKYAGKLFYTDAHDESKIPGLHSHQGQMGISPDNSDV